MAHGFVTLNIKHHPEVRMKSNVLEKRDSITSEAFVTIETPPPEVPTINKLKNVDVEHVASATRYESWTTRRFCQTCANWSRSANHSFEDQTFLNGTVCMVCLKKIWMKAGRQCTHCSLAVHKKCEEKLPTEHLCTPQSTSVEEDHLVASADLSTTVSPLGTRAAAAAAALSIIETTAIRSLRTLTNKNVQQLPTLTFSELTKAADQTARKPSGATSPRADGQSPSHSSSQTSFKLVNAASSAYSRLFEPKSKRPPFSSPLERKKIVLPSSSSKCFISPSISFFSHQPSFRLGFSENISESDLQDIFSVCKEPLCDSVSSIFRD